MLWKNHKLEKNNPCNCHKNGRNEGRDSPGVVLDYFACRKKACQACKQRHCEHYLPKISVIIGGIWIKGLHLVFPYNFDEVDDEIITKDNQGDTYEVFGS